MSLEHSKYVVFYRYIFIIYHINREDIEASNVASTKKAVDSTFNHPYTSDHHPLNFSPVKTAELFHDFIGPE